MKITDFERNAHSEMLRKHLPISEILLAEKAKEFGDMLGIIFEYSNGWLHRFKKRYDLKEYTIIGEAGGISPELVKAARERSKKVILAFAEKYGWHNIWNLDETALFYKLLPNSTLATERQSGSKVDKKE